MGVEARKQQCSRRVYFLKELGVEGIYTRVKLPVQSPNREAVVLHFGGDSKHAIFVLLNVREVPNRATAGGKEFSVVGRVIKMTAHERDQFPFLIIKGSSSNMNASPHMCMALRIARNQAFHFHHFRVTIVLWKLLQAFKFGDTHFPEDRHQAKGTITLSSKNQHRCYPAVSKHSKALPVWRGYLNHHTCTTPMPWRATLGKRNYLTSTTTHPRQQAPRSSLFFLEVDLMGGGGGQDGHAG